MLATGLALTVTYKKHSRERRQPHEQHEERLAMPSENVEQGGGQEYRRGKGDREIPNSSYFWLLLAVALPTTVMGCCTRRPLCPSDALGPS